jgi:hypothetical protein
MPRLLSRQSLVLAAVVALVAAFPAIALAAPIGAFTKKGAYSFVSAPSLHPPMLSTDVPTKSGQLAHGDFLLDSFPNVAVKGPMTGQGGPLILDRNRQPVWIDPVGTNVVSSDLQQETYEGKPVLVYWQGIVTASGASTSGQVIVLDQHYRKVATVTAAQPWVISLHDAQISGNDIWVTAYRNVPGQNLAAYGGAPSGIVYDAAIQEYDLKTGALVYTWDALNPGGTPNISLSASEQPPPTAGTTAWDAYHVNSVQLLPDNEMLVSMRNTSAAYLVNTQTNAIVWTLGGKASSFALPAHEFEWQHDVEMLPNGEVTLFDDHCCQMTGPGKFAKPESAASGLVLKLDTVNHTATQVARYGTARQRDVYFLGSMQLLPNGNALIGWGATQYFSEFSKSGKLLLEAVLPGKDFSYRALYTSTWVGLPGYPPSAAARTAHGTTTVYASWNGATQVTSWKVLGGNSAGHMKVIATKSKNGFETAIAIKRSAKHYKVEAVNSAHKVIGSSKVF